MILPLQNFIPCEQKIRQWLQKPLILFSSSTVKLYETFGFDLILKNSSLEDHSVVFEDLK